MEASVHAQPFDHAELQSRIARARSLMGERSLDALIVTSQPNIYYLSGFATKGISTSKYLALTSDGNASLFIPSIEAGNAERDLHGLPISEFSTYEPSRAAIEPPWRLVGAWLRNRGLGNARVGVEQRDWSAAAWLAFAASEPALESIDVSGAIDALRMVKSPRELEHMRRAAKVADAVSEAGVQAVRIGATEADIAKVMLAAMIEHGGEPPAGLGNVRVGARTGLVHTGWSDTAVADGDHVYLEFSGAVNRYHTVLWRTVFAGKPDSEKKRLALAMREANDRAIQATKPGLAFKDLDAVQREVIAEAGYGDQMFPFSGYAVGIALPPSWLGTLIASDSDQVMQPNMTFHMGTFLLKPGHWGMALSQAVLVTDSGSETLSHSDSGPYFK